MTRTFKMPLTAALLALAIATVLFATPAAAQIVSSAADNDMDPSFTADGWAMVTSTYQVVTAPRPADGVRGGYAMHAYLLPPDGNTYAGGSQSGGVPGIQAEISKNITGLTSGTQYAVESYIMSDNIDGGDLTTDVYFDVTFCGTVQETYHIPFVRRRRWIQESLTFTANAASCALSFRARGAAASLDSAPSGQLVGNGLNYIFLDSVQVSVATNSDFGIAASGPSSFAMAGSTETVSVTVTNGGPSVGTAPVVTYSLPQGVSVSSGAAGFATSLPLTAVSLSTSGPDAANWQCSTAPERSAPASASDTSSRQTITCTRSGTMGVGAIDSFSFNVDFAAPDAPIVAGVDHATDPPTILYRPGAGDGPRSSMLSVSPAFQMGNADPNSANDSVTFTTTARPAVCGNGVIEGSETCDDGDAVGGGGCSASCQLEVGYSCPMASAGCVDIDECALGTDNCDANATCANTPGSFTCACNVGYSGAGVSCKDDDECALGTDNCDANATCTNMPGYFICACNAGHAGSGTTCATICGDGIVSGAETCDDGNAVPGDGCDASCSIEIGWASAGEPSDCGAAACGDGCSQRCEVEGDCEGEPSACARRCDARSAFDAQTGKCVTRYGVIACNAQPGAPGSLTPLLVLGLLGLLLARRRQRFGRSPLSRPPLPCHSSPLAVQQRERSPRL
jgi:uncharacterized protein (TIGR03382 family)